MSVPVARSILLNAVPHGFCGRRGGVSQGAMASLNCGWGSGDDLSLIVENRRRAADTVMAGARIVFARPGGHRDPAYLAALIEAELSETPKVPAQLYKNYTAMLFRRNLFERGVRWARCTTTRSRTATCGRRS